jgi:5,10-methenyltetrahydromethanopterin hydrogenase
MLVVTIALVGGLSTQWYGCEGYADRKAVEQSREVMFEKSTEQVASAISYATTFVIMIAALLAITYAILWRGRDVPTRPHAAAAPTRDSSDPPSTEATS